MWQTVTPLGVVSDYVLPAANLPIGVLPAAASAPPFATTKAILPVAAT